MKRRMKLNSLVLLTLLFIGTGLSFAQRPDRGPRPEHPGMFAALELTEAQQTQMQEFRSTHQKEMQYDANLLKEKEAHLKTLLSAPERDSKAVNKTIDEISAAKGELMKKRIAHQEKMKTFLTPEQIKKMDQAQVGRNFSHFSRQNDQQGSKRPRGRRGPGAGFGSEGRGLGFGGGNQANCPIR